MHAFDLANVSGVSIEISYAMDPPCLASEALSIAENFARIETTDTKQGLYIVKNGRDGK